MRLANRVVIALLLVALAGTAAFAKTRKKNVTFVDNVTVNGTLVKAGNYDVVFDDTTNEMAVLKDGKVVVKTAAHVEAGERKARDTEVRRRMVGNESELLGVKFGGTKDDIVVGAAMMQAGGSN
jgi:hypothetical protein